MLGLISFVLAVAAPATASTVIPFALIDNRIVVQARINSAGPFAMILDTGSDEVVVTPAAAGRLKLRTQGVGNVGGAGSGRVALARSRIATISIGSTTVRSLPVDVIDLGPVKRAIGFPRLDGVIGYSMLRNLRVFVNADRRELTLSREPLQAPPRARSTTFTIAGASIHVRAAVDGVRDSFVVDTGDRSSLTLFRGFAQAHHFYDRASVRDVVTGIGIGGPIYSDLLRTTVTLFGNTIPSVLTRAARDRGGAFASVTEAGSIGYGLLKRFNVIFDFPRRTIISWRSNSFASSDHYVSLQLSHNGIFRRSIPSPDPTLVTKTSAPPRHAT
ncbi:MAG: clan AA aspartic protease [Candidatus Eremiobacteraeota bacterium]|nr:clan AA aspartic protease [Candidatus Eremiobacteraeota bacterium]